MLCVTNTLMYLITCITSLLLILLGVLTLIVVVLYFVCQQGDSVIASLCPAIGLLNERTDASGICACPSPYSVPSAGSASECCMVNNSTNLCDPSWDTNRWTTSESFQNTKNSIDDVMMTFLFVLSGCSIQAVTMMGIMQVS